MPLIFHDTVTEVLRERPDLAIAVLRDRLGVDVPDGLSIQAAPIDLVDRPSRDLHPDMVITVGPRQDPVLAINVEVENGPMARKRPMLPRYAAALWLRLDCPVIVLVICPDSKTATEASRPIATSLADYTLTPYVLGPAQIPVITDMAEVQANPLLAILSVAIHGRNRAVLEAFAAAALNEADGNAAYYYEYAYRMSPLDIRHMLEDIMATTWPVYTPYAKKHYGKGLEDGRAEGHRRGLAEGHSKGLAEGRSKGLAEGRSKGLAEGEAKAVLTVLEARGIAVPEELRARIMGCTDLPQLEEWIRRAATVTTAHELFTEEPGPRP